MHSSHVLPPTHTPYTVTNSTSSRDGSMFESKHADDLEAELASLKVRCS